LKTLQKSLRKTLTREEFVEKFYSKSKSSGSRSVIISILNIFDDFCLKVYGNNAEKLLGEISEGIWEMYFTTFYKILSITWKKRT